MFIKDDSEKVMLSLIEPAFIEGVGRVLTIGAKKYSIDNWKKLSDDDKSRYKDALLRHLYQYLGGDKSDEETGENHMLHIACNAMFLHYFDIKKKNEKETVVL